MKRIQFFGVLSGFFPGFISGAEEQSAVLLFEDDFSRADPGESWDVHPNSFEIREGALIAAQRPDADHGAVSQTFVDFKDAVIEFDFRFDGSPRFNFVIDDRNYRGSHAGHICRVSVSPKRIELRDDKTGAMENTIFEKRRDPATKAEADAAIAEKAKSVAVDLKPGDWHRLRVSLAGELMVVSLDGEEIGRLNSEGIAHESKTDFGFTVVGRSTAFDNIRVSKPAEKTAVSESPWNLESLKKAPEMRWIDQEGPIRELAYAGEPYQGKPTEVFAFYASPETIGLDGSKAPYPAVVLIHGGGGTAFAEWVWMWAKRGYAAIAMDLSGRRPPSPEFDSSGELTKDRGNDRNSRTRLEKGGPEQGHGEKFDSVGGDHSDDWPFHAVASVIRAHSLIRSFPEVDPERTAVTGISWGGYTTCLVASLDDRFSAAVPVYGCGFLFEGESVQKKPIDALEDRKVDWVRLYDPSSHLGNCRVPILFVNGTTDIHYPLDSYQKSYDLVPAPKQLRVQPGMRHSHPAGWAPDEIGLFIDSHCGDGKGLPKLNRPEIISGRTVRMKYASEVPLKEASLHFTSDAGPRAKRQWKEIEARIDQDFVLAKGLPENANTWLITVTDDRGAMVSSEVMFRKED